MRRIVVAGVLLAAIGVAPGSAGAGPEDTVNFHFNGRLGSVVLTDCPVQPPVGTECRAVSIFAVEQRVNDDGGRLRESFVGATLFDVLIIGGDEGFAAVPIGDGFTGDASVEINGLARGAASAVDVPLCETFACAPGAPDSVSFSVQWTGVGPVSASTTRDRNTMPPCFINFHASSQLRFADAVGEVNGEAWSVPQIPGFTPTLQADTNGSIQRCDFG